MSTNWNRRFISLAKHVATWSKDPSTKVGCVIADEDNRVVSLGYNGFPRGVKDSEARYSDKAIKHAIVVHAEENALLFAQRNLSGCTLYIAPLFPCPTCTSKIIQTGIKKVVCEMSPSAQKEREKDILLAVDLLDEAGVLWDIYTQDLSGE